MQCTPVLNEDDKELDCACLKLNTTGEEGQSAVLGMEQSKKKELEVSR